MNEDLHKLKQDFLDYWTLDKLQSMTLEEYTDTKRENSFCYWLEHITRNLGSIVGGSSYKFGIYKMGDTSKTESATNRTNDGVYAWHTKYGKTKEEAFNSIRKLILNITNYVKIDNLNLIDSIDLGEAYKWKIAFLYSDYNCLNIFKKSWLVNITYGLDVGKENLKISELNNLILAKKPSNEDFFDFSNRMRETYGDKEEEINNIISNFEKWLKKVYRKKDGTSLGKGSITNYLSGVKSIAKDFANRGLLEKNQFFIINDIEVLEDLYKDYFNIEEVIIKNNTGNNKIINSFNRFIEFKQFESINKKTNYWIFQGNPNIYNITNALKAGHLKSWKVAAHKDKIKNGDKVIIWQTGDKAGCYALAQITSDVSVFKEEQFEEQHYSNKTDSKATERVKIKILNYLAEEPILWKDLKADPTFSGFKAGNQGTNFTATKTEFETILNWKNIVKEKHQPLKEMHIPLNQILYGPPGTGKTYKTKAMAVKIIDGFTPETREALTERYFELMESGQIHFTTFHQSMSYEDFIEGIKPKMNSEEEAELSYEIQDGIFKIICDKAKKKKSVLDNSQPDIEPFDIAWDKLIDNVKEKLSNNELLKIGSWEYGLSSKESLKYESLNSPSKYTFTITKKNVYDTYQGKLARPSGAFQKDMKDILIFMKNHFHLKDFEEEPKIKTNTTNLNYVLIIDEINRGNVSAIFGELITLIETDKRAGENEAISVTLPYSKAKFSVPNNVFIIGTMNTADRSVEALDTALRRRFSFAEMLPDIKVLEKDHTTNGIITEIEEEINIVELLKAINERIELLIDKDHQIGHSYFFKVNSFEYLKLTFKDKIIPLLEEYFYGDFGKIGLVLGGHFVKSKEIKNKTILAQNFKFETEFIEEKELYAFVNSDDWTAETFTSIYLNTPTKNE